MISYNDLYDALRKERYSEQLQPLAKTIIKDFTVYIKEKKEMLVTETDSFNEEVLKIKKQIENSYSIFKELMLRRKKKLLELAFVAAETGISKRDFENMLMIEKECFDSIMKSLEKADKKINDLMKSNGEEDITKKSKNKMIVFTTDAEEFLDLEGNRLGPFKKGDFANIPEEIANILITDNIAESIDEE